MQKADYELFIPTEDENKSLSCIDEMHTKFSEMSKEEREFLNGIILRNKPKKLLEVGVSAGFSSIIMLNAIKNDTDAKLFSIDYAEKWYQDKEKNTGHIVDCYPDLKNKWTLFTGELSLNFMEKIGGGIDLCLIDTVHSNPGELLDILMVIPFLEDNATIILHDVNLHTMSGKFAECNDKAGFTNNILLSALNGKKYLQGNFVKNSSFTTTNKNVCFPNIAAIKFNDKSKQHIFEIFNLLTLKWRYLLTVEEEQSIINFFSKYYDEYLIEYTKKIFTYQRECYKYADDMASTRHLIKQLIKKILGKKIIRILKKNDGRFTGA